MHMDYEPTPPGKDPHLWHLARKRASFKGHLATYIIINIFFWILWYFNRERYEPHDKIPWPVWPLVGWGIGLAFHYISAFVSSGTSAVEKEYDKLTKK